MHCRPAPTHSWAAYRNPPGKAGRAASSPRQSLPFTQRHEKQVHQLSGRLQWLAYGQAKTANALFAVHLDALGRDDGIRAFALHPGKIITGLQREMSRQEQVDRGWIDEHGTVIGDGFKTTSQGAATGLWAATSPLLDGHGGVYLEDCDIAAVSAPGTPMDDGGVRAHAIDPGSAARLRDLSLAATGTIPLAR